MHVVIVGCGRVGSALATRLGVGANTVAVIDKRPQSFQNLPASFAGRTVTGFGFDRDRLREAGVEEADALAAVTSGDNSNIVVARIAKETFRVPHVMARIYDPGRASIYERLGIPTVATVAWTTDQALRRLLPAQSRTEWVDPTGGVAMVERDLPPAWAGRLLSELEEPGRWQISILTRAGEAVVPGPALVGQEGDQVVLAVSTDNLAALEARLEGDGSGPASR